MRAYHTLVFGNSGSGKTTYLREMHDTFPDETSGGISIWINHNKESVPDGRGFDSATTVSDYQSLVDAVEAGYKRINYHVPQETGITHVRSIAYHVTRQPVQAIVDESQNVLPDGQEDSELAVGLHEDRDEGVKWVLATQDPSDLDYPPVKQCAYYVAVGEPSAFMEGFLRYFSINREDLPDSRFSYVVMDRTMNVIAEGKTQSRYA